MEAHVNTNTCSVSKKSALLILSCILLAGLVVRILCFGGVTVSDDHRYVIAAGNLLNGAYDVEKDPLVYIRLGLVLPLVPIVACSGYSIWAVGLYSFVCGIGLIILAYVLGAQLVSRRVGLWAAGIVSFSTLAIGLSSRALPDMPLAFWCTLAIVLSLQARLAKKKVHVLFLCLAAGAALAFGWLTRASALLVVPMLTVAILGRRQEKTTMFFACVSGFCAVLGMEMLFWTVVNGAPLTRFHIASRASGYLGGTYELNMLEYLLKMFLIISQDGLFYYFLVAAVFWALARRGRQLWLPLLGVFFVFLVLQFGSCSLRAYRPFPHQPRYLLILVPYAAVLIGALFTSITRRSGQVAAVLFLVYGVSSVLLAYVDPPTSHTWTVAAKRAAEFLREKQAQEVYADRGFGPVYDYVVLDEAFDLPRSKRWLSRDFRPVVDFTSHPGAYVIRFDPRLSRYMARPDVDPIDLDQTFAWLDKNAKKVVLRLKYGRSQRWVMQGIWRILRLMPFPRRVEARLKSAFDRHLMEPVLIIYAISPAIASQPKATGLMGFAASPKRQECAWLEWAATRQGSMEH